MNKVNVLGFTKTFGCLKIYLRSNAKGDLTVKRRMLTKKPKLFRSFLIARADIDLWQAAAAREEVSQSEFVRAAIRERAARVLFQEHSAKPQAPCGAVQLEV